MSGSIKWRGLFVLICLIFALVSLAPSFAKDGLPSWWTDTFSPIQKGLDLQGGMHLVLGVDVQNNRELTSIAAVQGQGTPGVIQSLLGTLKIGSLAQAG